MFGAVVDSSDAVESELSRGIRLDYRPELDGLRAIAVLLVIAFHFTSQAFPLRGGFIGVDLFFVLSGFLITRLLFEEMAGTRAVSIGQFYLRRAARLLPALALVLLFVAVVAVVGGYFGSSAYIGIVSSTFYVSNWVRVFVNIAPLEHTWSLAIEEQFYIVWPILFVALFRRHKVASIRNASIVIVASSALETAGRLLIGQSANLLYNGTDSHGGLFLAMGCLLASTLPLSPCPALTRLAKLSKAALIPGVAVLVLLITSVRSSASFYYLGGFLVTALALVALITSALTLGPLRRALSVAPIVWVGRLSYGLYLWHYVMLRCVPLILPNATIGSFGTKPLALVLTFGVATLSFYFVERPLRRAIRRRTRALTPAAGS